jgi:hypothetical protein
MAGIVIPEKILVLEYKGHKFYADIISYDTELVHIDNKGNIVHSRCCDETEAMQYVDDMLKGDAHD